LDREAQPISEMSAAFLHAQDDEGVQFAYFQSYLVVKFLFEKYGDEAMQAVLHELGNGKNTNEALEEHVAPLEFLDRAFSSWARDLANQMGGEYELSTPETMLEKALSAMNPTASYQEALTAAGEMVTAENWEDAKLALELLIEGAGYIPGEQNAHGMLAFVYQNLEDTEKERETWLTITAHDAHNLDAVIRLLAMAFDRDDWKALARWSNAWLAINPLAETPWRGLLRSGEELGNPPKAIAAGEALVHLDPYDIASVHYRLAKQYFPSDKDRAHRQVLMALEEAPRFRDAYKLLDRLNNPPENKKVLFGFRVPPIHE
jgi:tetratricopeptide (TPR) repeat protein